MSEAKEAIVGEEVCKIVKHILSKQGLYADEDLYQSTLCYLCECAKRFDPARDVKWTTYAWRTAELFIRRERAAERRRLEGKPTIKKGKPSGSVVGGMHDGVFEELTRDFTASNAEPGLHLLIRDIRAQCTPIENRVIVMLFNGLTRKQIAMKIGDVGLSLNTIIKRIRRTAKEMRDGEE